MSYPLYSNDVIHELTCNIGEHIDAHEFLRFMERVSYEDLLKDAEEIGVLEKAISMGTIRLTANEHVTMNAIHDRYDKPCTTHGCKEELSYRIFIDRHGGYCDLCHYRQQKGLD